MSVNAKQQNKDVIYIDVDDEITSIISKLQESTGKIVALVLPKRAVVLQSIVNLKLLKHIADNNKKNIVLITSEASLLPLAGAVGVHVAKTLQSRPAVPAAPQSPTGLVDLDDTDLDQADLKDIDPSKPVGELAGMPNDDDETIEVDNDDEVVAVASAKKLTKQDKKAKKAAFNKKLKVPNFESFRTKLFIGIAILVLLLVGWFIAFRVMPRAQITIKTDNTTVNSNLTITASPSAKELNEKDMIVPAQVKQLKKTDAQKVPATGTKDLGAKASGTVTFSTLTNCTTPVATVPAGTTVSSASFNFITKEAATMGPSGFQGGKCQFTSGSVGVVAQSAGDSYNLSARDYAVSGQPTVTAKGSAMSGGVSKVVKVVQQSDVDGAKQRILEANSASVSAEISGLLKTEGFIPVIETLSAGEPLISATPNIGDEAEEVTVNIVVNYEMTGANSESVKKLLDADIKKQIDASQQNILDDGLDKAVIRPTDNKKANGEVTFTLQTNAQAGVQQNADEIRQAIAGMKKGEVQAYILARPGVKDVDIKYSPMWIYKTPKSINKITVTFQQSDGSN